MSDKILLIPLDSRPVNSELPRKLASIAGCKTARPPLSILGNLRKKADYGSVRKWLENNLAPDVSAVIVSIDMLAFGGLVHSRKPGITKNEALEKLFFLRKIKNEYKCRLLAFNVILRDSITVADESSFGSWKEQMENRSSSASMLRDRNSGVNREMIKWAGEGVFDYLLIGKEDTARGNPNGHEYRELETLAGKEGNGRVSVQAGADELAQLLAARHIVVKQGISPRISVDACDEEPGIIPAYEPVEFRVTIRRQIESAGCLPAGPGNGGDAVIVPVLEKNQRDLFLDQVEHKNQGIRKVGKVKLEAINSNLKQGKSVGVVDKTQLNGSDRHLVDYLLKEGSFLKLCGYAGWNTTANSSGTVVAQLAVNLAARTGMAPRRSALVLLERLAEDYVYSCVVREKVNGLMDDRFSGCYSYGAGDFSGSEMKKEFDALARKYIVGSEISGPKKNGVNVLIDGCEIVKAFHPWKRLFEIKTEIRAGFKGSKA
ncbi:MAG TPA: DUF4127 family protein [bacterium]|nr:DUF4127 family protein [bacterium]